MCLNLSLNGFAVIHVDFVLNSTGASKLILFLCKDVMKGQHQLFSSLHILRGSFA